MLDEDELWVETIRKESRSNKYQIYIYVATNVDSVCCTTMLSTIYKNVSYSIVPIENSEELFLRMKEVMKFCERVIFILINCGGLKSIEEELGINALRTRRYCVYLLDSHRPIHHTNLFSPYVRVVSDISKKDISNLKSYYISSEQSTNDDEDDDRMNLEDDDDDYDSDFDDLRDFIEAGDDDDENPKTTGDSAYTEDNVDPLIKYYEKNTNRYGVPSSYFIYTGCGIDNLNPVMISVLLWQAVVGLTESYLFKKITPDKYKEIHAGYSRNLRMFLKHQQRDDMLAEVENEVMLVLYRHWNLRDSMLHSSQVVSFFRTWKKEGRDDLAFKIAVIGLSNESMSKQFQGELSDDDKKVFMGHVRGEEPAEDLDDDLFGMDEEFTRSKENVFEGMEDFVYSSFTKNIGMDLQVSASDMVYAIMSLVEEESHGDDNKKRSDVWKSNFKNVFEILKFSKTYGIHQKREVRRGLNLAIGLQKIIVKQVHTIMNGNFIKDAREFFYVHLVSAPQVFQNKLGLTKLALFLYDVLYAVREDRKPLVVSVNKSKSKTVLLIGVDVNLGTDNIFSLICKQASKTTKIAVEQAFDTSIVVLKDENLSEFLECMNYEFIIMKERIKTKKRKSQRKQRK